jgi:integrase
MFIRIIEWDWPDAPARVPIVPGDIPKQDHPLPTALDDAAAAKLLRAAQSQPRMLVRVVVEVLLRTGLRVGEFVARQADAIVLIGAGHWLHVPVGKLRTDCYPRSREPRTGSVRQSLNQLSKAVSRFRFTGRDGSLRFGHAGVPAAGQR